jgi:TetR/AcrR family transcriptional repressor of nem operon
MGRPIEYDQSKVLDSVVKLFWAQGYEATSMKNICEITGLQPGSVYAAFGSKRALFLASIDAYFEQSFDNLKAILAGEGTPLERVRELFMYIVGDTCRKDSHGCLLVNALLETTADDAELRKRITAMFRRLEFAIQEVLVEAAECGELVAGKDPTIQARLLINNIFGLRVYAKLQPDGLAMREMVGDLLSALKSHPCD